MPGKFVDVLRRPDFVTGADGDSPFRFEERGAQNGCPVEYEYAVQADCARVIVYPGRSPVKYLKLRFQGDLSFVDQVMGDQWERSYGSPAPLEWRSVKADRILPWFCYLIGDGQVACYGVKTGANCFAFWQADTHGITLFLNLMCGNEGTSLKEPIVAAEVVQNTGEREEVYQAACRFAARMCGHPKCPGTPVFGVNNWYWAYGRISEESVLRETDYLCEMTEGTKHSPYMIIDDGWQLNRTYGPGAYIGGPWMPNDRFPDMKRLTSAIHERGVKTGIWFRPLLTLGQIPEEAKLTVNAGGQIMDPSHPYTLERVKKDAAQIRSLGFDLIKHDYTCVDIFGSGLSEREHGVTFCREDRSFYDKSRTTAMIVKDLYCAIQEGAGDDEVIGCNVIGHLSAGIHSIQRVGDDTSGRSFEWTVRNGVNSMMRLPQNGRFFMVDPDCAAFTEKVSAEKNLDFLEMCALTGVTTLASVTPGILNPEQMERIRRIYRIADQGNSRLGIENFEKTALPEIFVSQDGGMRRVFDWESEYHGSRCLLSFMQ